MAQHLPDELLLCIFVRLDPHHERLSVLRVCAQWRRVGCDRALWAARPVTRFSTATVLVNALESRRKRNETSGGLEAIAFPIELAVDVCNIGRPTFGQRCLVRSCLPGEPPVLPLSPFMQGRYVRSLKIIGSSERALAAMFAWFAGDDSVLEEVSLERCNITSDMCLRRLASLIPSVTRLRVIHAQCEMIVEATLSLPFTGLKRLHLSGDTLHWTAAAEANIFHATRLSLESFHADPILNCERGTEGMFGGDRFPSLMSLSTPLVADNVLFGSDATPPRLRSLACAISTEAMRPYPSLTNLSLYPGLVALPKPLELLSPSALPQLQELNFCFDSPVPLNTWRELLISLPNLKQVTLPRFSPHALGLPRPVRGAPSTFVTEGVSVVVYEKNCVYKAVIKLAA